MNLNEVGSEQLYDVVTVNENFLTLDWAAVYGKKPSATSGLTWAYYGGIWGGFSISAGTLTLTNGAANYIVVNRSTGAISVSTSSTNWDNIFSYARVYKVTTAGSVVTAEEDHRAGANGIFGPIAGSELRGLTFTSETGSTADSDPGAGLFKWNHATQSSATVLYFDNQTADGQSLTTLWGNLAETGFITLQQADDPTKWQEWRWSAVPVDGTGYRKFTVSLQASGGSIADAKLVLADFESGVKGAVVGPSSATDNAITRFDGTTGKVTQNSGATVDDDGKLTAVGFTDAGDTWANVSATTPAAGTVRYVTDVGGGSHWVYKGGRWAPLNGSVSLLSTSVPMILPSSGNIGNNGALTGITALPNQHPHCFMYFPANAIAAGVAAGVYYVAMSSTTAGTIYNNTYTGGQPVVPSSPTAFATVGPGAYTQTTGADITLLSVTVPANAMGIDGRVETSPSLLVQGTNVNNKTIKWILGGTTFAATIVVTGSTTYKYFFIGNTGKTNAQSGTLLSAFNATTTNTLTTGAVDTTTNQTLAIALNLAVATDFILIAPPTTIAIVTP